MTAEEGWEETLMESMLDFPIEIKADSITEDGHFEGYGSTFNGPPDAYGDVIAPGAFTKTIRRKGRNGNGIALLWQHKADSPIGVWKELVEDQKGLRVKGQLAIDTQLGGDTYKLAKMGAVKGMSIGYDAVIYEEDNKTRIRTLKEVNLWEISLVTFPANIGATVTTVKDILKAKTPREFERALREAGLSGASAKYVVSLCKDRLDTRDASPASTRSQAVDLLQGLRDVNASLEIFRQIRI